MPTQQRKIGDGPVRVKDLRLGRRSGSSWINGVCRQVVLPQVAKAHHRNDKECHRIAPSSNQPSRVLWGNHGGADDRDCHTHNLAIALCALQRPTCPQSSAIDRHPTRMYLGRTHHADEKSKGRKKEGYISKEFCAKTDLCPLASPRVALVGVCLLRHPDKGNTR